jgi:predicted DNA-binding transcriptional regulator YafY
MPVNKAARFRFEIIDECLRNTKKKWSKKELLRHVNRRLESKYGEGAVISISQIRYDVENLQSEYNAPIELYKSGKNYYYRYEDENFSIKNIPINEEEITSLNVAVQVLKQIKGLSIAYEIADIVKKLESRYNYNVEGQKDIIVFECGENESGVAFLEDIYHAIIRKNVLKITYRPPLSPNNKTYNIHPYLIKEYNNFWHLLGYCHELKKIEVYEMDRMAEVKVSSMPYKADLVPDIENYFKYIIGVTKPTEDIQTVRLHIDSDLANYITIHPIHHSQKIQQFDNGCIEIELNIIINNELINLLLGYGQHITALSPAKLIVEISYIAKNMLNSYSTIYSPFNLR